MSGTLVSRHEVILDLTGSIAVELRVEHVGHPNGADAIRIGLGPDNDRRYYWLGRRQAVMLQALLSTVIDESEMREELAQ